MRCTGCDARAGALRAGCICRRGRCHAFDHGLKSGWGGKTKRFIKTKSLGLVQGWKGWVDGWMGGRRDGWMDGFKGWFH